MQDFELQIALCFGQPKKTCFLAACNGLQWKVLGKSKPSELPACRFGHLSRSFKHCQIYGSKLRAHGNHLEVFESKGYIWNVGGRDGCSHFEVGSLSVELQQTMIAKKERMKKNRASRRKNTQITVRRAAARNQPMMKDEGCCVKINRK